MLDKIIPARTDPDTRMPVYYLSHGGGPWPFMEGPFRAMFTQLERSLQDIPRQLPAPPRALLVISGHWEEAQFTVSTAPQPGMIYDYAGFPESMYQIHYPAPGSPELAAQVAALLEKSGWPVGIDPVRGFDHGTYSLLKPLYPDARIPVVQLSLRSPLDPAEHINVGRALTPLRDQGVLILGSGQSFHTMHIRGTQARQVSETFDAWLRHSVQAEPDARAAALIEWEFAPNARIAHPHADHLMPLHVAVGAAGNDLASCVFSDYIADLATSAYRFGKHLEDSTFDTLSLHERHLHRH
ncbi:class III extradiol ring-cleavage dioxygenase [Uliginosibacterium sp. TH139]|uniref:DODA-type extradiol aromatic ring-opening family dioxygenase n=1 Tax=Uliginosibacterium sp. TH139 TaxID=2067453 RepID=UPI000C79C7F5|nr:class III extradiol ring-cleavage dioxygenase [Uliginosibacterium sp. TH139]PLK47035.1 dioxygenase [Uliginosibacterium sp. TH139]